MRPDVLNETQTTSTLIVMFQPDIVYWAAAVAVVVFLNGVLEVTMAYRIRAAGAITRTARAA